MGGDATGVPWPGIIAVPLVVTNRVLATGVVTIANQVLGNAVAVAAGSSHGLALRADGTVVGWGGNLSGEATGSSTPYPSVTNGVVSLGGRVVTNVTAIAAGQYHSLALRNDGKVAAWGANESGQSSVPEDLNDVIAIAAGGNHSLALKRDTTVVAWGLQNTPPTALSNVLAIATCGEAYAPGLALVNNGAVVEWTAGAVSGRVRSVVSNAVAIAAGRDHCLALLRDGTVFGWGFNGGGGATGIPTTNGSYTASGRVTIGGQPITNVVAIAAGNDYSLALEKGGTVVAWGRWDNGLHPAVAPAELSNVVAIAAGGNSCLAITTNAAPFTTGK
jgi:alpha-tubulin suppressor-like RCC1 family protein